MEKNLRTLQNEFGQFVLHGTGGFEGDIVRQGAVSNRDRVSIYRNAYRLRLRECIETDHDVLGVFLGDDTFEQLVTAYVDEYPSRFPSLRQFCDNLPDFLRSAAPYRDHPVVSDLARFERCLLYAFDAADGPDGGAPDLAAVAPEAWPDLRFEFHPSCSVYNSNWNVVPIWQAIRDENVPPAAEKQSASNWMISRNQERLTIFRSMPVAEAAVIDCWMSGGNFAAGCEAALAFVEEAEISAQVLHILLEHLAAGTLCSVKLSAEK